MLRRSIQRARGKAPALRCASSAAAPESSPPAPAPLFDKILIANRGEITVRIAKTARKLGIKTVAVYSDPDANAMHVHACDEAVCVGPAASSKSYLNIPRILGAIESTGAQAVHPGYGFLSENAGFVGQLEARGVSFIGPSAYAMDALGDKIHSKQLALKAGVRTVPGFVGDVPSVEDAVRIARDIGYPVMIKASAGGGGKGMRVAYNDAEVALGYRLSQEEARSSFGDDRLLVEKFIEQPRHIEIQLIADKHGNIVPLPERECSIQRRNQKVIEESPSTFLDAATRAAMQDQAAALAAAVNYTSAGTVEFLCDAQRNFYFLEMNTRLQVEHPVTEAVTGLDLVDLMIRVAAGERLPSALTAHGRVPILGHAFESRVYAEDPFRGFLPSTGRLSTYIEPASFAARDPYLADGLRADAGVSQGSDISMFYDPMICKLISHGPDRASALDRMRAALDAYVIKGVGHNIPFLRDLCDHPRFVEGRLSTGFIAEEYPGGFKGVSLDREQTSHVVAGAALMNVVRQLAALGLGGRSEAAPTPDVTGTVLVTLGRVTAGPDGTPTGPAPPSFAVSLHVSPGGDADGVEGEHERAASSSSRSSGSDISGEHWEVRMVRLGADSSSSSSSSLAAAPGEEVVTLRLGRVDWALDEPLFLAHLPDAPAGAPPSASTLRLQCAGRHPEGFALIAYGAAVTAFVRTPRQHELAARMLPKRVRDLSRVLVSPMPGTLVSLAVVPGQLVEEGQEVAVVEAMKMQNVLRAPRKGRVAAVPTTAGQTLAVDQVIVEFASE